MVKLVRDLLKFEEKYRQNIKVIRDKYHMIRD